MSATPAVCGRHPLRRRGHKTPRLKRDGGFIVFCRVCIVCAPLWCEQGGQARGPAPTRERNMVRHKPICAHTVGAPPPVVAQHKDCQWHVGANRRGGQTHRPAPTHERNMVRRKPICAHTVGATPCGCPKQGLPMACRGELCSSVYNRKRNLPASVADR